MKKIVFIIIFVLTLSACEFDNSDVVIKAGIDTVEVGSSWIDAGAYVKLGVEQINMTTTDTVDTNTVGFYDITYTLTHEDITYEGTRRVAVVSKTQIDAVLNPGIDTMTVGNTWVDAGVTVESGASVTVLGVVDTNTIGTYTVTYTIRYETLTLTLERIVTVTSE